MKSIAVLVQIQQKYPTPVLVWGSPGVGKSSYIRSIGEALNVPVEIVIASIREPSDFAGLPIVEDKRTYLAPPAWATRLAEAGRGILFLDEINTAPPAVQAVLMQVVLNKVVGELRLPQKVAVIAAANPPEEATGGWDLSAPLANRFVHIHWKLDVDRWIQGMISGWPLPNIPVLPENWDTNVPVCRALIASFIKIRPHLLSQVPNDEGKAGKAWPSPRTWEMAAIVYAAAQTLNDKDLTMELIAGCVGESAALEFMAWIDEQDLPDPEELLRDPDSFKLPNRGDKIYAVLSSVVAATIRNLTHERWLNAWTICAKATKQGAKDFAAAAVQALAALRQKNPSLPLPVEQLNEFLPILKKLGDA
ncbi:MAG: AAA family ATPase [Desulfurococcales archaeon]|nr:AAA family ATPase [Desulfurococcales archaeon]